MITSGISCSSVTLLVITRRRRVEFESRSVKETSSVSTPPGAIGGGVVGGGGEGGGGKCLASSSSMLFNLCDHPPRNAPVEMIIEMDQEHTNITLSSKTRTACTLHDLILSFDSMFLLPKNKCAYILYNPVLTESLVRLAITLRISQLALVDVSNPFPTVEVTRSDRRRRQNCRRRRGGWLRCRWYWWR